MKKETKLIKVSKQGEKGLSMLEYAAAAAVLIGVVYAGMTSFGGGMSNFFTNLGGWATNAGSNVGNSTP